MLIPRVGHFSEGSNDGELRAEINTPRMQEMGAASRSTQKEKHRYGQGPEINIEAELMKCVMPACKKALQKYMTVHSSFIRATVANWVAAKVYGQQFLSLQQAAHRQALLNIIMGHKDAKVTESYTWVRMVSGQVATAMAGWRLVIAHKSTMNLMERTRPKGLMAGYSNKK